MIIIGVFFFAALMALSFKDNIEMFLAASVMLFTGITYFFMQIGFLRPGLYLVIVISAISFVFCLKKGFFDPDSVKKHVLTFGGGLFLFLIIFFYIFSLGHSPADGADSNFWVGSVKLLYYTESIDIVRSRCLNPQPLFMGVWSYLVEVTWPGRWSDEVLFLSKNLFMFSCMLPFFHLIRDKFSGAIGIIYNVLTAIMIMVFPYIGGLDEYSIYLPDMIMGIAIGMGIMLLGMAFNEEKDIYLWISLCYFASALQFKRIAVVMVVLCYLWIGGILAENNKYKEMVIFAIISFGIYVISVKRVDAYSLGLLAAFAIGPVVSLGKKKLSREIKLVCIFATGAVAVAASLVVWKWSHSDDYIMEMTRSYITNIFWGQEYHVGNFVRMSPVCFLMLVIVTFAVIFKLKKDISRMDRKLFWGTAGFFAMYLAVFAYLYPTDIGPANPKYGFVLAGFDRYLATAAAVLIIVLFYIIMDYCLDNMVLAFVLTLLIADTMKFTKYVLIRVDQQKYDEIQIIEDNLDIDTKVAYVVVDEYPSMNKFALTVLPAESFFVDVSPGAGYVDKDTLMAELREADYVYIERTSDYLKDTYGDVFELREDSNDGILYGGDNGELYLICE